MSDSQISDSDFLFYSDYFASSAISGIKSAQSIFKSISTIESVDLTTFVLFDNAFSARNNLISVCQSSYEVIFNNGNSLEPMRNSFTELADHIKKFTGSTLDAYITSAGLKVERIYANISGITGNTVLEANIK